MPIGERVMPVVEVGAVPRHAEPVEPGGAEFGFKTFAEIAFGLRVQVNASEWCSYICGVIEFDVVGIWPANFARWRSCGQNWFSCRCLVRCRLGWWSLSTQMAFLPNALAPGVE